MSFRDLLVVLRPYPAGTPDSAVDFAVATAVALGAQTSAIACAITPKVPRSILGDALIDISAMVADERNKSSTDAQSLLKKFEEAVAKNHGALGEDAMPILQKAKHVRLLTVLGEKPIDSVGSGAEFDRHLALHGVNVVVDEVDAEGRTIGEVLQEQAKIHEIDLIVMGAYGRSRLRKFILGGSEGLASR